MSPRRMIGLPDAAAVAERASNDLARTLIDRSRHGSVHVALTGGGVGTAMLAHLAAHHATEVPWHGVHLWWGDERYLPAGHPDRNDTGARSALIHHIDIPAGNVHPIPADDVPVDVAAAAYAEELLAALGGPVPHLDVVLLGMGPDGHVASLFPWHPAAQVDTSPTVAVLNSPKPPPTRISLTMPVIRAAAEVWLMVAGSAKAPALARAWEGSPDLTECPASVARGTDSTTFYVDGAATADISEARD